jgi:hypothetical protein
MISHLPTSATSFPSKPNIQICSGTEESPVTGHNNYPYPIIRIEHVERLRHLIAHMVSPRIVGFGAVQRKNDNWRRCWCRRGIVGQFYGIEVLCGI